MLLRPLPDVVVVVGRARGCAPSELALLVNLLVARRDLAAITTGARVDGGMADLVEHGAVFRGGPLCQAGGFGGDRRRSVHDRLSALGFDSIQLAASRPVVAPLVVA